MNIFPVHTYEPKDRPWVIRLLRYMGVLTVIVVMIVGIVYSGNILTPIVQASMHDYSNTIAIVVLIVGALISFIVGIFASLPLFGMALLLDDIHAIRVQTAAYAATGPNVRDGNNL